MMQRVKSQRNSSEGQSDRPTFRALATPATWLLSSCHPPPRELRGEVDDGIRRQLPQCMRPLKIVIKRSKFEVVSSLLKQRSIEGQNVSHAAVQVRFSR